MVREKLVQANQQPGAERRSESAMVVYWSPWDAEALLSGSRVRGRCTPSRLSRRRFQIIPFHSFAFLVERAISQFLAAALPDFLQEHPSNPRWQECRSVVRCLSKFLDLLVSHFLSTWQQTYRSCPGDFRTLRFCTWWPLHHMSSLDLG